MTTLNSSIQAKIRVWLLLALPDEDSLVYETFEEEEGPPTKKYAEAMYGGGYLFEYDLVDNVATNGRMIEME